MYMRGCLLSFCAPNINCTLFLHKNEKCSIQNGLMQMSALPSQIDGNRTMGQGQSMGQFAPPL